MKINPDQPAFAQWHGHAITSEPLYLRGGLTVRAYIAAKALQGILASWNKQSCEFDPKAAACRAVTASDALITELNKQP